MATFDLKMYYQKLKLTCCSISLEMKPYCTVLPQMSSVQCVVVCGELCVLSGVQKETNNAPVRDSCLFRTNLCRQLTQTVKTQMIHTHKYHNPYSQQLHNIWRSCVKHLLSSARPRPRLRSSRWRPSPVCSEHYRCSERNSPDLADDPRS